MKPRLVRRAAAPALCAIIASFVAPGASAQPLPVTPDSGAPIRIWRPGAWNWEQATFLELAGDSLVLIRGCCGIDTVPMADVQSVAVINGRERRVSRVIGWAAMGAAVGAIGGIVYDRATCPKGNELCGIGLIILVPWTALGGAVIGGLLGSRKVDRWERIYPPDSAALMVVPKRGRVDISVALRL